MKIGLTSVPVRNPIEAYKFYTEILGFKEKLYMPEANLAIVVSPEEPDGTAILLEPIDKQFARTFQEELYKSGLPIIVFSPQDIDKEYERLKGLGVSFKKAPTKTDWGTEAIFDDTCGNLIQLFQP